MSRPQGDYCHLEGLDGRGRGGRGGWVGVHRGNREGSGGGHSTGCSFVPDKVTQHMQQLLLPPESTENTRGAILLVYVHNPSAVSYPFACTHKHGRAPGWNKPIRPTMDGKVIGRARPITDPLPPHDLPHRQPPIGTRTPSSPSRHRGLFSLLTASFTRH